MVQTLNVSSTTSSITLSRNDDTYIVNAAGGSVTLTLPSIFSDGETFIVARTDTSSNTVIIQGTGGQTIDGVTTVTLNSLKSVFIFSKNSAWYSANRTNPPGDSTPVFSANFRQTNSVPNIEGTGSNIFALAFSYAGSGVYGADLKNGTITVGTDNSASGAARLRISGTPDPGATGLIATWTWPAPVPNVPTNVEITTFTNLPTTETVLELYYDKTGGTGKTQIYSLVLR